MRTNLPSPIKTLKNTTLLSSAIFLASLAPLVHAEDYDLEVVINKQAPTSQHQVAFVPLGGDNILSDIILSDLRSTSLTVTSDPNILINEPHSTEELTATISAWQSLGIPYLVIGDTRSNRGETEVHFQVVDLTTNPASVQSNRVIGANKRSVAHKTANRIYEMITGNKADFDAKIVYIEEKQGANGKVSTLKMMDADGENVRNLSSPVDGSIFSPAVSPDGRYIAYSVQLINQRATLWIHDLRNNIPRQLVSLKGDNLSPTFSPDGRRVLFQSTFDGDADIYQVDVATGNVRKVLDLPFEQTQPSFASQGNGESFVFASDHASPNNPSIYRASFSGDITRLTQGRNASNPSYSPDGSKIGYLNGSSAAVMSSSGASLANFGNTAIDQAPSFSPSGERVVYAQGRGQSTIVIRSLTGGNAVTKRAGGVVQSPVWVPSGQ